MGRSRRHPPLFEVLGEPSRGKVRPSREAEPRRPLDESDPELVWERSTAEVPVEPSDLPDREPQHTPPRPVSPQGRVSIPVSLAFFIAAGAIFVVVIVYLIGYRLGHDAGTATRLAVQDTRAPEQTAGAGSIDTRGSPGGVLPGTRGTGSTGLGSGQVPAQQDRPTRPDPQVPPAALVSTMTEIPIAEPREIGMNYLELCRIPWEDAREAVEFLGASGVRASASPNTADADWSAERRLRARERNDIHVVYVLVGIPGDEFTARADERERIEREVRRIGKDWLDQGGASDFSKIGWRKYKG